MTSPVTLGRHGDIALLRIDNPPVNALSPAVVDGLIEGKRRGVRYVAATMCVGGGMGAAALSKWPEK